MEYLLKWQEWLEHSPIYTEFLIHLPSPLNNVYFDLVVLIVGGIMLVKWIFNTIAMRRRYKKIRNRQKKIQEAKEYADMESMYREHEARKRQEQMEQQMKLMQMYVMLQYMPKQYQGMVSQERISDILGNGLTGFIDFESRVVAETPILEGRNRAALPEHEPVKNEFERLMEILGTDESMQQELQNKKAMQDAMVEQNQRELDKKLKSETTPEETGELNTQVSPEMQKELERRKAMAVKLALKEKKRAERKKKWGGRK